MGKAAKFLLLLAGRFVGLLDEYSGAAAAYSLRNLSASTTNVVKVRRSSDDTEQDFTASDITGGTLLSFVNQSVEKIGNGDFSDGSTGWTVTNGSITGGQYVSGTLTAYQSGLRRTSFTYTGTGTLTFDLVVNSGSIRVDDGGAVKTYSSSGTQSVTLTNPTKLEFNAYNLGFDGTIDNVSFIPTNVDGFVTTWYDQSGNGNNATQATAASQPKIVSSGTLVTENGKAAVQFDGTDDYISVSGSLYSADINLFLVLKITTTPSNYHRIAHLADGVNTYQVTRSPQADNYVLLTKNTEYNTSTDSLDWGSHTGQLLVSTRSNNSTDSDNVYVDSVAQVEGGNNIVIGGGNNSPSTFGTRNDLLATSYFDGSLQEIIIYHSDQSANRTGIEDNINAHYNIYT